MDLERESGSGKTTLASLLQNFIRSNPEKLR
jgi:ABC-type dipeptide/oligopeptide/nickel transport system ATPase subunit